MSLVPPVLRQSHDRFLRYCRWLSLSKYSTETVTPWLSGEVCFGALNRLSSHRCGFELSTYGTSQVLLARGQGFPVFRPTLRLTRFKMNEIILMGCKTQIKKNPYELHHDKICYFRCEQQRHRSVCASVQSGQCLYSSLSR